MIPSNPLRSAFQRFANPVSVSLPDGSQLSSYAWISPVQKTAFPQPDELSNPADSPAHASFFLLAPPDSRIHEFARDVTVSDPLSGKSFLVVRANLVSLHASPIYVWALLIPDLSSLS